MSKRKASGTGTCKGTSTCKGKASASTGDGPEDRPTNRPRYQPVARAPTRLVSRPTSHLVSRPKGVGRGGSCSVAGNGDRFADERGDIGEYIDEGNRHVVRPRGIHGGRGGRSSVVGNGDRFRDDRADIGEYIDEGNRHIVRPRGIHGGRGGRSSAAGNGDRFVGDWGDIGQNTDEGNRPVVSSRGIHRGRGGRSSVAGNGDRFPDDQGDIGQNTHEGNRYVLSSRGIHRGRFGNSAIGEGDQVADDYVEDLDEGTDGLDMEASQRRRGSNIADTPPNESSQRSWIYPYQNGFIDPCVHRQITSIFKYSFDGPWATWKEVPKRDIKLMWERFQELYQWDARVKALVEKNFKDYLSKRFSDVMRECRLEAARRANEAGTPLVDQDFTILKPYPPGVEYCYMEKKSQKLVGKIGAPWLKVTPSTGNSYVHESSVASSEEVENLKGQLAEQEKVALERERVTKELQQAAEERERAAEQRIKELKEQVKNIANMLKTLKPPPSPPPS